MPKILVFLGIVATLSSWSGGATHSWVAFGGGTYQIGSNWSGGVVPAGSDTIVFPSPAAEDAVIRSSTNVIAAVPTFSAANTRFDLTQHSFLGGTLSVSGSPSASATFANGTITVTSAVRVGSTSGSGDGSLVFDAMTGTLGTSFTSQMLIGRVGGGTLIVTNGSSLTVNGIANFGTAIFSAVPTSGLTVENGSYLRFTDNLSRENGIITVRNGGHLQVGNFVLGSAAVQDSVDVIVDGPGSMFTCDYQYVVGSNARGSLSVINGGQLVLPGLPGDGTDGLLHIGQSDATGTVTISGAGSMIDTAAQVTVGQDGVGNLLITNGGRMVNRPAPLNSVYTGAAAIGRDANGIGNAVVSGAGSRWDVLGELSIAHNGVGTLELRDAGFVDAERIRLGNRSNGLGRLIISGNSQLVSQSHFNAGVSSSALGNNARLTLTSGGVLSVAGETRFNETSSIVFDGGQIDLNRGAMLMDHLSNVDPTLELTALVASAYAGGAWNGSGIMSSAAAADARLGIAVVDRSAWPGGTFAGEAIDPSGKLLRVTLRGDADGNLIVDISDFATLAANFNRPGTRWRFGDFDYDGVVNIADFAVLASNFNQSFASTAGRAVPEPQLSFAVTGGCALLARRRRSRDSR